MEKKKNIIFISGIDTYGVRREKERWKKVFRDKYGSENMEEVRIEEMKDWSRIEQDIQSMGLFAEKRLWCFSGGYGKTKKEDGESSRKKKGDGIEEKIISLCEMAGEDHFFIFSNLLFDAEKGALIPWLKKYADVREFTTIWSVDTWSKRFSDIDEKIIKKVLDAYKEAELGKEETSTTLSDAIGGTLEKLSLLQKSNPTSTEIEESLDRAYSGKMFDLSDSILALNTEKARNLFLRIIDEMPVYEFTNVFLPSLIGVLRGSLYAKYLSQLGHTEKEIGKIVPIHPYVLSKTLGSKISYTQISNFYKKLIDANIAYKSGRGMRDGELGRIFAIELALMGLKKNNFL